MTTRLVILLDAQLCERAARLALRSATADQIRPALARLDAALQAVESAHASLSYQGTPPSPD